MLAVIIHNKSFQKRITASVPHYQPWAVRNVPPWHSESTAETDWTCKNHHRGRQTTAHGDAPCSTPISPSGTHSWLCSAAAVAHLPEHTHTWHHLWSRNSKCCERFGQVRAWNQAVRTMSELKCTATNSVGLNWLHIWTPCGNTFQILCINSVYWLMILLCVYAH